MGFKTCPVHSLSLSLVECLRAGIATKLKLEILNRLIGPGFVSFDFDRGSDPLSKDSDSMARD